MSEQPRPDHPAWRERPTVEGYYLLARGGATRQFQYINADHIKRDVWGDHIVYGPIPSPPEEMKKEQADAV